VKWNPGEGRIKVGFVLIVMNHNQGVAFCPRQQLFSYSRGSRSTAKGHMGFSISWPA
jgi:hypothetical protein